MSGAEPGGTERSGDHCKRRSRGLFGLIVASGDITDYGLHRSMLAHLPAPDRVYCADGGLRHIKALDIVPDFIIGDFDSADGALLNEYRALGVPLERLPAEKDYTDTELAVNCAVSDGCASILILGALGARIDHAFANLLLIYKSAMLGVRVALADANGVAAALVPGRVMTIDKAQPIASILELPKIANTSSPATAANAMPVAASVAMPVPQLFSNPKLSIFPAGGPARGVDARNVKYTLRQATLEACYTSGVSNEFLSDYATIELAEGALYVMVCGD